MSMKPKSSEKRVSSTFKERQDQHLKNKEKFILQGVLYKNEEEMKECKFTPIIH